MSFVHSPKIVTDGLVLSLDAGNVKSYPGSGTVWTDKSGFNNNGTLINGPTFNSDNGGSIVFDGSNDGVNLNNNFISIQNNVTVEVFIKSNTTQNTKIFVSNYTQVSGPTGFGIGISDSTNNVIKWFTGNLGTTNTIFSNTVINNNQYYHVVGTYDGSTKILYVNGIAESSASVINNINNTSTLANIGYVQALSSQYFNGSISNARVYNRALSAQEVLQNYNATKSRFGLI
jgi:hypothetical protein